MIKQARRIGAPCLVASPVEARFKLERSQSVLRSALPRYRAVLMNLPWADPAFRIVVDSHVLDRLEDDVESRELLTALIAEGKALVLMPHKLQRELTARAAGVPNWLPIHQIPDAADSEADVFVSDDPWGRRQAQQSGRSEALSYDEFVELLKLLRLDTQSSP